MIPDGRPAGNRESGGSTQDPSPTPSAVLRVDNDRHRDAGVRPTGADDDLGKAKKSSARGNKKSSGKDSVHTAAIETATNGEVKCEGSITLCGTAERIVRAMPDHRKADSANDDMAERGEDHKDTKHSDEREETVAS